MKGGFFSSLMTASLSFSPSTFRPHRCLQNYIPAHSLTLSCPVCRQTSILPEKGVSALQNNFFITNLMDVLQRTPENSIEESSILETVTAVAAGQQLAFRNLPTGEYFLALLCHSHSFISPAVRICKTAQVRCHFSVKLTVAIVILVNKKNCPCLCVLLLIL